VARVRLFGPAVDAVGSPAVDVPGATVGEVLAALRARHGEEFATVLGRSRVWLNGDDAEAHVAVGPDDEVAVLPPVSGG